jgi:hypothetical protein
MALLGVGVVTVTKPPWLSLTQQRHYSVAANDRAAATAVAASLLLKLMWCSAQ